MTDKEKAFLLELEKRNTVKAVRNNQGTLSQGKGKPSTDNRTSAERNSDYWGLFGERLNTNGKQLVQLGADVAKPIAISGGLAAGAYYAPSLLIPSLKNAVGLGLIGAGESVALGTLDPKNLSLGNVKDDALVGASFNLGVPILFKGVTSLGGKTASTVKGKTEKMKPIITKKLEDVDKKLGFIVDNRSGINTPKLVESINKNLTAGLGIKKGNHPLKVSRKGNELYIYSAFDDKSDMKMIGLMELNPLGTEKRPLTQLVSDIVTKKKPPFLGMEKLTDFPTMKAINENTRKYYEEFKDFNFRGVGGEVSEAIKRGLKDQNEKYILMSSRNHLESGSLRHLHNYLNGRNEILEGATPRWLEKVEQLKKAYPNGISKEVLKELVEKDRDLITRYTRFTYKNGGIFYKDEKNL